MKHSDWPQIQAFKRFSFLSILMTTLTACEFLVSPYHCDNMPEEYKDLPTTTEYMFTLWRPADQPFAEFAELLFGEPNPNAPPNDPFVPIDTESIQAQLHAIEQLHEIKFIVLDEAIKSFLNERPKKLADGSILTALISISVDSESSVEEVIALLTEQVHFVAGYTVERAIPVEYDRQWPGEPPTAQSEGLQLVSMFERKDGLEDQEFYDLWHCSDTPFAIEIHPFWRYERNVVVASLTEEAPNLDGIVLLHAREDDEITDMTKFLGGNLFNGIRVQANVDRFLNLSTLNANAMREWIFRSDQFE